MDPLAEALIDARVRTLSLVADLDDDQWMGPRLAIVNPLRWELGHLAWFQEYWTLRRAGADSRVPGADALFDSTKVAHDTRWDLPLLGRALVLGYLDDTLSRSLTALEADPAGRYFHWLALGHEDMHGEAFTYTRQTLAYPRPLLPAAPGSAKGGNAGGWPGPTTHPWPSPGPTAHPWPSPGPTTHAGPWPGDAEVPGARFLLGAREGVPQVQREPHVFDNEKWAHPVDVASFRIARAPVTNAEYAGFVEAGGYRDRRFWSDEGWLWRAAAQAGRPVYWEPGFRERRYDRVRPLSPHAPVIHVSWHEAEAFCRWAGRRLPSEAEWELAAGTPDKRPFPWGDAPPDVRHANLDGRAGDPVDVAANPEGDSAYGCRQMIGNVWEWTASDFAPYPGFAVDPYKEYSAPWFATPHKVLRGGCWATRGRLLRNTWRNFYPPDRRDVLAGFRTCAL